MVLTSDCTSFYGIYGKGTAGQQQLYSINPSTGGLTLLTTISGTGFGTYFYGAGIASAVPEPSTYALAAITSGTLALIARRRKARRG
jgi:hypothetical protein